MPAPPGRLSRRQLLTAAAGLGLVAAVGPLAGCSRSVSISDRSGRARALVLEPLDQPDSCSPRPREQIPDTAKRLRADVIGGTFDTKLRTSLAGKAYIPDITAINSNCALYFTNEDLFVDLNTLGAERVQDGLLRWKWQLGTHPDRAGSCFWPMDTGPTGLYYRSDLFERSVCRCRARRGGGVDPDLGAADRAGRQAARRQRSRP